MNVVEVSFAYRTLHVGEAPSGEASEAEDVTARRHRLLSLWALEADGTLVFIVTSLLLLLPLIDLAHFDWIEVDFVQSVVQTCHAGHEERSKSASYGRTIGLFCIPFA